MDWTGMATDYEHEVVTHGSAFFVKLSVRRDKHDAAVELCSEFARELMNLLEKED